MPGHVGERKMQFRKEQQTEISLFDFEDNYAEEVIPETEPIIEGQKNPLI